VPETSGWGRQVTAIQAMPKPTIRNADQTLAACLQGPAGSAKGAAS
jgi:dihydroorotase